MRSLRAVAVLAATGAALAVQPAAMAVVRDLPSTSASFNGTVMATARSGNVIYVGGSFTSATDSTGTHGRRHLAAVSATTGRLLAWSPSTNSNVLALAVSRGRVFAGGQFTRTNGVAVSRLVQISASSGRLVRGFRPRVNRMVRALALSPSRVYAGGKFTGINGHGRRHLAALSRTSGAVSTWAPRADSAVRVIRRHGSQLVIGGSFRHINGRIHTHAVAIVSTRTGGVVRSFHSPANYLVNDIRLTRTRIYMAMSGPGGRVMASGYKGGVAWRRVFNGDVNALSVLDGTLYIGGHFTSRCTTTRVIGPSGDCRDGRVQVPKLAATTLGGTNRAWSPAADSDLGVLAMSSVPSRHALVAGGDFNTFHNGSHRQPKFALFRNR